MEKKAESLIEVNHSELINMVEKKYESQLPFFIWGAPGIGKSDVVRQAAKELAEKKGMCYSEDPKDTECFRVIDKRLAQMDASDIKGIPTVEDRKTHWTKPSWFPTEGSGILFFDELNLAAPIVQAAAYEIILDRRLGEYKLPEGWTVVSAGNRAKDRAHTFEMPKPLLNRFTHVTLGPPNVEQWTDWAIDNEVDPRIITYINQRPGQLHKFNPDLGSKAFPTPRSVAMAATEIEGIESEKYNKIQKLAATAVGPGWASEFTSWLKLREEIDINYIIENPTTADIPSRADLCYSIVSGVAERWDVMGHKETIKVAAQLSNRLQPEYGALLLRMLKKKDKKKFMKTIRKLDCWKEIASKYAKFMKPPKREEE